MLPRLFDNYLSPLDSYTSPFVATDAIENEDCFELYLDIPGIDKKDVSIEIKDNKLEITGERTKFENNEKLNFRLSERKYGKFGRTFLLPNNLDTDKIGAEYKDGVLKITIPKSEKALPKQIEIQ